MLVDNVEFIILGSGTSAGVPIIGCDCWTCTSKDPRDRRTRPGACLKIYESTGAYRVLLIDTTPDLREQVLNQGISRLDAILYTHSHADHIFGLDDVRRFNALMGQEIPIYGDTQTLEELRRIFQHIFAPELNVNQSWVAKLQAHTIKAFAPFDLYGLRFTPLDLLHGNLPVLGYRIEALDGQGGISEVQPGPLPLAYCTDVSLIPEPTWEHLEGLRTLILDMLRPKPHPTHLSCDQAIEIAKKVRALQTYFVHMTHDIRHAEFDAILPEGMQLSYDGLVL